MLPFSLLAMIRSLAIVWMILIWHISISVSTVEAFQQSSRYTQRLNCERPPSSCFTNIQKHNNGQSSPAISIPLFVSKQRGRCRHQSSYFNRLMAIASTIDINKKENDGSNDIEDKSLRKFPYKYNQPLWKLIWWPFKLLFLKPLSLIAEFFIDIFLDNLDDDGTVTVGTKRAAKSLETPIPIKTTSTIAESAASPTSTTITTTIITEPDGTFDESEPMKKTIISTTTTASNMTTTQTFNDPESIISTVDNNAVVPIDRPTGTRWAVSDQNVDFTGNWKPIMTEEFRKDYDKYLEGFGQSGLVRTVALNILSQTSEEITQLEQGKSMLLVLKNIRGAWSRTLVSSGTDSDSTDFDDYVPLHIPIKTADGETVEAESWWEDNGTIHVSWLRGSKKYSGGNFESRRYLEDNGNVYVCESIFHYNDKTKQPNRITWRWQRQEKYPKTTDRI